MESNETTGKEAGRTVLAIGAHPDDIEFWMAGTLVLLKELGWEAHYLNIANGCCGSLTQSRERIAAVRKAEALEAAALLGAKFHESVTDDLCIYPTNDLIAKVAAVVRRVRPRILLVHSPDDYMADHENACRIAVAAGFVRGVPNFQTDPLVPPISDDVCIYHAMPHGLRDPLRRVVRAGQYVNIGSAMPMKREMLAQHRSQKEWLDATQGFDSYLATMEGFARQVGKMSGTFEVAEGWRRHQHLGFSTNEIDPLTEALGGLCIVDLAYESGLGELPST